MSKKCGFIALIGPSNAGKSTFLNAVLDVDLSIVCHKSQTTRTCISGIHMQGETQMVFLDTPGIFRARKSLERRMVKAAWESLEGAHMVFLMVDATRPVDSPHVQHIIKRLEDRGSKVDLILNKVDLLKREKLLPLAQAYMETGVIQQIFMTSSKTKSGFKEVLNHIERSLPESPWLYPEDQVADVPSAFLAAEMTRERLMHHIHEEIPYMLTVFPEAWEQKDTGIIHIIQTIIVQESSHKSIILGAGGKTIKRIGSESRERIEALMGQQVHLVLHVRVDKRWQERVEYMDEFSKNT